MFLSFSIRSSIVYKFRKSGIIILFFFTFDILQKFQMQRTFKIHENVHYVKLFVSMPLRNIGLHNYRKHRKNACIFSIKVRFDM